jgi:hypothetical protein
MDKMLSNYDIENIVGEKIPVILSSKLHKYRNMDDIFPKGGNKALILYQDSHQGKSASGHWCCVLRNPIDNPNDIYFYDSYGKFIDDQLKNIHPDYRKKTNQTKNYLSDLLYDSDYNDIHYNPHKHQESRFGINTCGRHCAAFLKLGIDPEEYDYFIKKLADIHDMPLDKLIVKMTENFI